MTTNQDFLKTHDLYVLPQGDFIPLIITKPKHPLISSSEGEPIFDIHLHINTAKTLVREVKTKTFRGSSLGLSIKEAEDRNQDHIAWCFSGNIYLPKT